MKNIKRYNEILNMKLEGRSYADISKIMGISRQRVQQILSPPHDIYEIVAINAKGKCQTCGLWLGKSGHIHHTEGADNDYSNPQHLQYLCVSCHRKTHSKNKY